MGLITSLDPTRRSAGASVLRIENDSACHFVEPVFEILMLFPPEVAFLICSYIHSERCSQFQFESLYPYQAILKV